MNKLYIGSDRTMSAIKDSIGETITNIIIIDDNLFINFDNDKALRVWDGGQQCCEHRYMKCDDDLNDYIGATLTNVYSKPAIFTDDDWGGRHEIVFIEFETTNGVFTIVNHNAHNGYYGGFYIEGEITEPWLSRF